MLFIFFAQNGFETSPLKILNNMMHLLLPLDKDKNIKMNRLLFPYNGTWNSVRNRCVLFHTMSVKRWSTLFSHNGMISRREVKKLYSQVKTLNIPSLLFMTTSSIIWNVQFVFSAEFYLRFIFFVPIWGSFSTFTFYRND